MENTRNSLKEKLRKTLFDGIRINKECLNVLKGRHDYYYWKRVFEKDSMELLEIIKKHDR